MKHKSIFMKPPQRKKPGRFVIMTDYDLLFHSDPQLDRAVSKIINAAIFRATDTMMRGER